jgi:GNAT superfamily N-acetyltransferase
MAKTAQKFDATKLEIVPVKFITKQEFETTVQVFAASYANKIDPTKYDQNINKINRLVLVKYGDEVIARMLVLDFVACDIVGNDPNSPFWAEGRKFNTSEIDILWVKPAFRNKGIATMLYRYAIERMGVNVIAINGDRVATRINYWKQLGFTHCSGYSVQGGAQNRHFRLHLTPPAELGDISGLYALTASNILYVYSQHEMYATMQQVKTMLRAVEQCEFA